MPRCRDRHESALEIADQGGEILVIGYYAETCARFPWNHVLHRELELIGSNASAGAWLEAVRLATELHDAMGRLISRPFPASQFAVAVDLVRTSRETIKVVLCWDMCRVERGYSTTIDVKRAVV